MKIVISGVNFNEGGPLSVLKDCLNAFQKIYKQQGLDITVYVHKRELVADYVNDFDIIEYPLIKTSWLRRLYFEYVQCKKISKALQPDLWIALHDMTPNVTCKQVVYCHNPAPFHKMQGNELFTDTKFFLFCFFYKFLYGINIKKNRYVIVQQEWLRQEFEQNYGVNTVVAHPIGDSFYFDDQVKQSAVKSERFTFFYPAFPRVAKNFEVLLKAAAHLSKTRTDFEVQLSINGDENKYAETLYAGYGNVETVKFIGRKSRPEVFQLYNDIDCMVFPSRLETWGLPISECKTFKKPMLLANFKYAHETLGEFNQAKFFDADDYVQLANYMALMIDGKLVYDDNLATISQQPCFNNWDSLVSFLSGMA